MPAPSPAPPTTIEDAPIDVLERALAMMIEDEQFSTASLFASHHPVLYPRLAFHLQNRRQQARAPSDLDGRAVDEQQQIRQLEERLAGIRHEVACHAIGAPYR